MIVLLTGRNEDDTIKSEGDRVLTKFYVAFFRPSKAANSDVSVEFRQNSNFQPFMIVLVTCKNEEDHIKMKTLECLQDFLHYKSMGIFSNAQGQLTPQCVVKSG